MQTITNKPQSDSKMELHTTRTPVQLLNMKMSHHLTAILTALIKQ